MLPPYRRLPGERLLGGFFASPFAGFGKVVESIWLSVEF